MTALGWITGGLRRPFVSRQVREPRRAAKMKARPQLETLETIELLSAACPVISGHVFLDENTNPTLTNNGILDPGEKRFPNAQVELLDATGKLVATATTDQNGFYAFTGVSNSAPQTPVTVTQTLTIGDVNNNQVLTNFNQPLSPNLQLFNPSLGTLTSVNVTADVSFKSVFTYTNTSTKSPAIFTAAIVPKNAANPDGTTYTLSGIPGATITGTPSGSTPPGGIVVPAADPNVPPVPFQFPVQVTDHRVANITDPATLAQYTASPSQSTLTGTMAAVAKATSSASDGNKASAVMTSASSVVTVTFTYVPTLPCLTAGKYTVVQTPEVSSVIDGKESQNGVVLPPNGSPPGVGTPQSIPVTLVNADSPNNDFAKLVPTPLCPVVGGLVRFGVHHQQTQLVLSFIGTVDPTQANTPGNYSVVTPQGQRIPIVSATFDATTNSVTLVPARRLNAHYHFTLSVKLPCNNGTEITVPFGGKATLGGFTNEAHNHFFKFVNGHAIRVN